MLQEAINFFFVTKCVWRQSQVVVLDSVAWTENGGCDSFVAPATGPKFLPVIVMS